MITNLDKIHPCKRDSVSRAVKYLEEHNKELKLIDKMVIFGSAITDNCTDDSDIDVCIYSECNFDDYSSARFYGKLCASFQDVCDVFDYRNIDNKMRNEIANNGVIVYESAK